MVGDESRAGTQREQLNRSPNSVIVFLRAFLYNSESRRPGFGPGKTIR